MDNLTKIIGFLIIIGLLSALIFAGFVFFVIGAVAFIGFLAFRSIRAFFEGFFSKPELDKSENQSIYKPKIVDAEYTIVQEETVSPKE